jgi:hypothetical protein
MLEEACRAWHEWSHWWPPLTVMDCPCSSCEAKRLNRIPLRAGIVAEFRRVCEREGYRVVP